MRHPVLVILLILALRVQAQWTEHVLEFTETDEPRCVRIGDLDGDGDGDIAACSYADNKLVWYEQVSPGVFGAVQLIVDRFGMGATAFDLSDLDGDGDLDVLGTWEGTNELGWLQNDGAGAFTPMPVIDLNVGYQYRGILSADLDGDGDRDVVSAVRQGDPALAWYANAGAGVFGGPQVITTAIPNPGALRALDVDGDGDIDLVLRSMYTVVWLTNDGTGLFSGPFTVGMAGTTMLDPVDGGDMDGDGDMDVVHGAAMAGQNLRWTANMNGSFTSQPIYSDTTITGMMALRTGDMDNDGDVDLVMGGSSQLAWQANDGQGSFAAPILLSDSGPMAVWVELGDIDLDGDIDVACASRTGSFVGWVENLGGGSFGPMIPLDTCESRPLIATAADLDNDGDMDIVRTSSLNNELGLLRNLSNGNYAPAMLISNSAAINKDLQLADLDGDQDVDLITTRDQGNAAAVEWFENDGTGHFGPSMVITDTLQAPRAAMSADVDQDGDRDVVAIGNASALVFPNDGSGSFGQPDSIPLGGRQPFAMALGDADNDGDTDLILSFASGSSSTLSLFLNDGNGLFGVEQVVDTSVTFASPLTLLDLDSDGDNDLLFRRWNMVYACWNDAGGLGAPNALSLTADTIATHTTADLNDDGAPDIITSALRPYPFSTIYADLNDGTGGFMNTTTISIPLEPSLSLGSADLDGDGDEDVLGYSGVRGVLTWFENPGLTTSLTGPVGSQQLHAWPSPFTDRTRIRTEHLLTADHRIELLDAQGRVLRSMRGNGTKELLFDRGDLASGLYLVRISRNGSVLATVRVVAE